MTVTDTYQKFSLNGLYGIGVLLVSRVLMALRVYMASRVFMTSRVSMASRVSMGLLKMILKSKLI